jgi:hypothetical protein
MTKKITLPSYAQAQIIRQLAIETCRNVVDKKYPGIQSFDRYPKPLQNFIRKLFNFPSDLSTERIIKMIEELNKF